MAAIAKPMGMLLNLFYGLVGSYGFAIILFTLVIKFLLLPLTMHQMKSTKSMSEVQPKLKALQEKYKNDKEKLNVKTMELYKEHKVNPMGGCLPLLIQMPVLFGLFALLKNPGEYITDPAFVAATQQGFYWISNLSMPDTKMILPILAAATTYISMQTANTGAVGQNQTMKTMNMVFPLMMLWWGRTLAAGLILYWVVSNVFQIAQQYFMPKPGSSKEELN
ncbi:membrane protein insertase YidC [Lutibacter sp. B2]|nr:membrane protein insertase YidC [Lutibacter sp. B2]